jgi:hypothetical protein
MNLRLKIENCACPGYDNDPLCEGQREKKKEIPDPRRSPLIYPSMLDNLSMKAETSGGKTGHS